MISKDLMAAAQILQNEGLVAMPTETVYGLAANIYSKSAVRKIFELKERPFFDPLIVHIHELDQIRELTSTWPKTAEVLANEFWPGALTLVLPKSEKIDALITASLPTVGIRMPSHPSARALLKEVKFPLAAPSANKFGKVSPTTAEHVQAEFGNDLFILEGDASELGVESTVVRVSDECVEILRPGLITMEMISDLFKKSSIRIEVRRTTSQASPGNLENHYRPKRPLFIFDPSEEPKDRGVEFKLPSDPLLAARILYASLRELSEQDADFIFVRRNPYQIGGAWEAIWDRLNRAAEHHS